MATRRHPGPPRLLLIVAFWGLLLSSSAAEIVSYAMVQEDGSLKVQGERIHLYGIHIPLVDHTCHTFISPVPCGYRPVLWLEFKIGSHFVHCYEQERYRDGSIGAICTADEVNLNEWMLRHGWAVARPDAPFEYRTLERIARERNLGIWGLPVDRLQRRDDDGILR